MNSQRAVNDGGNIGTRSAEDFVLTLTRDAILPQRTRIRLELLDGDRRKEVDTFEHRIRQ